MRRRSGKIRSQSDGLDYTNLRHYAPPDNYFSEDHIGAIHDAALTLLEEKGLKILNTEAREIFARAGARVDGEMVYIGREVVETALQSAPRSFALKGAQKTRDLSYELGAQIFGPAGGCPNVYSIEKGRRAGTAEDFEQLTKLQQSFDVIHILGPSTEPQEIDPNIRHLFTTKTQLALSDKLPSFFARGRAINMDNFEILACARGVSNEEFAQSVWTKTVINTNSPRMMDDPMAEGIIDFARNGQLSIITPFCLAGAMAPITLSGALCLQHGEALAGIALAQLAKSGAPVSYGGFASNVNMRSGSPAFGTPEHIKLSLGTGQLARFIGMPFRLAAGSASNMADAQGTLENTNALWASARAGATLTLHAAGWLEGGLSCGYEKFINDVEALQIMAELAKPPETGQADLALGSLQEVKAGGHFFEASDTMERYQTAFYQPLVANLDPYETWEADGKKSADQRAADIWKDRLARFKAPEICSEIAAKIAPLVERKEAEIKARR